MIAQAIEPRFGHEIVVFDPHSTHTIDVQPRFQRHDITGHQRFR